MILVRVCLMVAFVNCLALVPRCYGIEMIPYGVFARLYQLSWSVYRKVVSRTGPAVMRCKKVGSIFVESSEDSPGCRESPLPSGVTDHPCQELPNTRVPLQDR